MKLSVVVITYNQELTVGRALDSILSQEHPYSMEIIVADDASNDRTPDIVAEYATKYPNIIKPILRDKNLGLIGNYFDAISNCTGEYIGICAGDDYWLPNKVAAQISYMDSHQNIGLSYTRARIYDTVGGNFRAQLAGGKEHSLEVLLQCNQVPAVTIMMSRKFIDEYLCVIDPLSKKWFMEDYPMVLYAAARKHIGFIPIETACYCITPGSISNFRSKEKEFMFDMNAFTIREEICCCTAVPIKLLRRVRVEKWFYCRQAKKKGIKLNDIEKNNAFSLLDFVSLPVKRQLRMFISIIFP